MEFAPKKKKILYNSAMAKYDVIVVGAGNAGLSAALQMALSGKKVLILEQHNLPGGCATSFRRGRFEIEPSLHELCDLGPAENPGSTRKLFDEYGINVEWANVEDCFRAVSKYSDGSPMDVTMPCGTQNFIDKMEFYVPGSRKKMIELFELLDEILDGIHFVSEAHGKASGKVLMEKFPNMLKTGAYSTEKVFKAIGLPRKCRDIMSVYWPYLGVDTKHLPFIHYAAMIQKYIERGAYIPQHTSHEISVKMTERFRELGGEIYFNCKAQKFLFKDNKIYAVQTNCGIFECNCVLANINPEIIYGKMIDKNLVPEREKKLSTARNGNFGGRMITAYFCLDESAENLGIKDYSIFLMKSANSSKEYKNIMRGFYKNDFSIFLCYNVANPNASPKGTCIVSFTTFASPKEWENLSQENYFDFKNKFATKFVESLREKTGIDISNHIEEMSVASPWTFARYLNVPEGSVYGYEAKDWDGMMARMMMLKNDYQSYKIKGLFPIGASGPRGDGYNMTYIAGQTIAKIALKEMSSGQL